MKYRPDNWGNPFHKTGDFGHGVEMWNEQPEFSAFEAGADAILEALKKSGLATPIGHWVEAISKGESSNTLSIPYDDRGWLVFIPDVEGE